MKNNNTRGWKKVFGFTFIQYVKTKSFIAGTIIIAVIMMLLASGVNLIPKWLGAGEMISGTDPETEIILNKVYVADSTGTLTDEDLSGFTALGFPQPERSDDVSGLISRLSDDEAGKVLVTVTAEEADGAILGYAVKTYYSPETDGDSVDAVSSAVVSVMKYRSMLDIGVKPEDFAATQRYYSTSKIQAGSDEWGVFESMINYIVPIVFSLVLFIFVFAYGQTVAQAIATEKTSRVMELLLTSVRPLAVVIGKVLAMCLVSIMQFLVLLLAGGAAFAATAPFGIGGDIMKMMQDPALQTGQNAEIAQALNSSFGTLSPLTFILILVIFILGFMLFALIAALVGASVSRMEDLAQAMQPYSLLGVLGFYLAYFPIMFTAESFDTGAASSNGMQMFSYYFPISSPFSLPSALLLGTLSLSQVLVAILVLAAFVALVAVIVARVYEMIILHNGSRLKFKDILNLAFGKK